jgi:anti-sigma-K factor RskA
VTHEQAIELLEEYVLGTLASADIESVEEHLESGCKECQARLAELGEIVAAIADIVPQQQPSADLKGRILASLASQDSTHSRSQPSRHGSNIVRVLAIISTAAAILLAVWSWKLSDQLAGLEDLLEQSESHVSRLEMELDAYMDATSLLATPGMQFIDLAGVAPNEQAFGKVVLEADSGQAVVYMYELPPTPEGMTYQLWMMRDGVPTSAGTFTVAEDGSAKLMLDPMPDMGAFASFDVTIEPAGGMPEPTGMMYLTGQGVIQSPVEE